MKNQYPDPTPTTTVPKVKVNDSMRRLQIGIAGVFAVLLLVGLAGLVGDRAREEAAEGAVPPTEVKMPGDEQGGGAPLEELGVQPVTDGSALDAPKAPAKSVPLAPGTTVPDLEPDPALERARQSAR